jgi:eukaryotic-like serine/threonine-protein kinase
VQPTPPDQVEPDGEATQPVSPPSPDPEGREFGAVDLPTDLPPLVPGSVLDHRYELQELIAAGGMSTVWRGLDRRLHRTVAVKVVRDELIADLTARIRFEHEARMSAGFHSPHIVDVYDVGMGSERQYLVMELVDGETLGDRIDRGAIEPVLAVAIADRVLAALEVAHAAGTVHRDVKPGNVLLPTEGGVKLVDFGIAKAIGESMAATTGAGQVLGTPSYLSPEQVAGQPAGPASDVYAVGTLLYEMICGAPPFAGGDPLSVALARQTEEPVPLLAACGADVSRELADVVARALARDPADRYPGAAEMRAALGRATSPTSSTTVAPPPGSADAPAGPDDPTVVGTAPVVVPAPAEAKTDAPAPAAGANATAAAGTRAGLLPTRADGDPTVVDPSGAEDEPTVRAPSVVEDDPTVRAPSVVEDEATRVAPAVAAAAGPDPGDDRDDPTGRTAAMPAPTPEPGTDDDERMPGPWLVGAMAVALVLAGVIAAAVLTGDDGGWDSVAGDEVAGNGTLATAAATVSDLEALLRADPERWGPASLDLADGLAELDALDGAAQGEQARELQRALDLWAEGDQLEPELVDHARGVIEPLAMIPLEDEGEAAPEAEPVDEPSRGGGQGRGGGPPPGRGR